MSFALRQGFVPHADDVLGEYDGVLFTVQEASATIKLVNMLTEAQLDVGLGLDIRAVDNIIDAQPVATVDALARLYYVGQTALLILKEAATGSVEQLAN